MEEGSIHRTEDLIINIAETRLGHQRSTLDSVDVKTGVLLSAQAVLLSIVVGMAGPLSVVPMAAEALLLAALALGVAAYFGGPLRCDPDPETFWLKYRDEPVERAKYAFPYATLTFRT